jgi:hypothetical protein
MVGVQRHVRRLRDLRGGGRLVAVGPTAILRLDEVSGDDHGASPVAWRRRRIDLEDVDVAPAGEIHRLGAEDERTAFDGHAIAHRPKSYAYKPMPSTVCAA